MTVKELIERLQQMPQDLSVYSTADYDFVDIVRLAEESDEIGDAVVLE